jgi:hypothetical protein
MRGSGEKFSRYQERAIAALISQPTIAAAAKSSGLAEMTLRRWQKLPAFAAAYAEARRALVSDTIAAIQKASGAALAALLRIIVDPQAASTSKVQAARTVLEIAIQQRPAGVHVPAASNATEIGKALETVSRAVARGDLLPVEAQAIAAVFRTQLDAVTAADLERRLAALEGSSERGDHEELDDAA